MTRKPTLFSFITKQIEYDGFFYFLTHPKECFAHCRNQKRLSDENYDSALASDAERHAQSLFNAGEIGFR